MNLFSVEGIVLEGALAPPFKDFQDAVLHEAARAAGVDLIVTRNIADFKHPWFRFVSRLILWRWGIKKLEDIPDGARSGRATPDF